MSESVPIKVLLIEDDDDVLVSTSQVLTLAGYTVESYASVERAHAQIAFDAPCVVVCDVRLPGLNGTDWLPEVRAIDAELPVVLVTAHGDIAMAVRAMRDGAYDFIEKPFTSERLLAVVRHAVERRQLTLQVRTLHDALENWHGIQGTLIGRSAQMQQVRRTVMTLAQTSADVLIYGETGTGKDLVARCLHDHSERRRQHFVPVNCGGLPEALAESELFGHEAGAFTGASRVRVGKFEYAHGGTLFLDEIESMPMGFQVKLLRVLQERRVERLGSNEEIPVDLRVVAATKADLKALCEQQKFRSDLYYRLDVAVLRLPPLRERREDVPLLFEHFCSLAAARHGREPAPPGGTLAQELMAHDWPGNVRELRNVAERYVLGLGADHLGALVAPAALTLAQQMDQVEKVLIEQALKAHRGRMSAACEALGIGRKTLYDKLARHGIAPDTYRTSPGEDAAAAN